VDAEALDGVTALMLAARSGLAEEMEVMELLLEAGADAERALIEAARSGRAEVARLLIEAGAR